MSPAQSSCRRWCCYWKYQNICVLNVNRDKPLEEKQIQRSCEFDNNFVKLLWQIFISEEEEGKKSKIKMHLKKFWKEKKIEQWKQNKTKQIKHLKYYCLKIYNFNVEIHLHEFCFIICNYLNWERNLIYWCY